MRFIDTFDNHRNEPKRTFDAYVREQRLQLGEAIAGRYKVYLDTKYWLLLRDHLLGVRSSCPIARLSKLLHDGVAASRIICPISADIFLEIVKQSDANTLQCSAELIDTLSCGVSVMSSEERVRMELLYFVQGNLRGRESCHSPNIFVWTKTAYTLGITCPAKTPLTPDEELVLQKVFFDHMWQISLCDMLTVIGADALRQMPRMRDISAKLNKGKFAHADENRSYRQMFMSEIAGVIDVLKPTIAEMMAYLYECNTGEKLAAEDVLGSGIQPFVNLIYNGFCLNRITTDLPSIRIPAAIHAAVRWDSQRSYKPNDMHDFHHAEAALPYCDMFLTEKSLKHLLTRRDMALDVIYNCRVISDPSDAVNELQNILTSRQV